MESRGNENLLLNDVNIGVYQAGSTLHWGPDWVTNKFLKTHWVHNNAKPLSDGFHTYEFVWTPDSIVFNIDGKLVGSVTPTKGGFWEYGGFPEEYENPWKGGTKMAPFDQEFYLILNLAVGGIGYFPDEAVNPTGKPWKNNSTKVIVLEISFFFSF